MACVRWPVSQVGSWQSVSQISACVQTESEADAPDGWTSASESDCGRAPDLSLHRRERMAAMANWGKKGTFPVISLDLSEAKVQNVDF